MTSVASILNDVGIPWPDADSGKARDAARAWSAIAQAATDAMSLGGSAATTLTSHNSGAAMDAFSQYWAGIGGPYDACVGSSQTAMLPVLADACNALSAACEQFADAVDQVKSKLEDTAGEIAAAVTAGAVATFLTVGISDFVSGSASAALVSAGLGAVELFGITITDIAGQMAVGAAFGAIDTMIDQVMTAGVKAELGEQVPTGEQELEGLFEGSMINGVAGGVSSAVESTAKTAAIAALANIPDDVSKLAPDLTAILAGIPNALETPAGKAVTALAGDYTANSGVAALKGNAADPPSMSDILGELLDAKIEAAAESGNEKGEK